MRTHSLVRRSTTLALVTVLAGCGGAGDSTAPPPSATTTYMGTFADGSTSGGFSMKLASSADLAPAFGAAASSAPTSATGSLSTVAGTTVALTGTFDFASGALQMSGGAYTIAGSAKNGTVSGSVSSTHGNGAFSAAATSASGAAPKVFCGTYASSDNDAGWFNLIVTDGKVSGVSRSVVGPTSSTTSLTGSITGSAISLTSSDNASGTATVSADGTSLSGTFTASGGASGTFQGATADCGGATSTTQSGGTPTPLGISGLWQPPAGQTAAVRALLIGSGTSVSGSGTITVSIPNYTGNDFTITSGSFSSPNITFGGTLGRNPDGHGGSFVGSISFTGTVSGNTMTGTLTYTPPRTLTQAFSAQTVTGVTMSRQ